MKKCILIIAILCLGYACKKESIKVDQTYVEGDAKVDLRFGGMLLTLKADGKAELLQMGDIFGEGSYHINGKKIVVTIADQVYEFRRISKSQLLFEKDRILVLRQGW